MFNFKKVKRGRMVPQPLVSIAIITYNQIYFIHDTLFSALTQNYGNLEVVVADDGSTDGTAEVILEYTQKYPNILVPLVGGPNLGITGNSNRALSACRGKYIAIMGGDDMMLPGKISAQVELMEANPDCAVCFHDLDVFDTKTGNTLYILSRKVSPRNGDVTDMIAYGPFNGACSTMVRSDKTPQNGFEKSLPVASDWMYWIDTLANGGKILFIDSILGKYRKHSGNVTNRDLENIGQNQIDHLNTCNLLLKKYPHFMKYIMVAYSRRIFSLRWQIPYFNSILYSLKIKFTWKSFLAFTVYLLTFGLVKL